MSGTFSCCIRPCPFVHLRAVHVHVHVYIFRVVYVCAHLFFFVLFKTMSIWTSSYCLRMSVSICTFSCCLCTFIHVRVVYVHVHLHIFVLSTSMSIYTFSCCLRPCPYPCMYSNLTIAMFMPELLPATSVYVSILRNISKTLATQNLTRFT